MALELVHSLGEGLDGWGGGRLGFQLLEKCCCLLGRLPVGNVSAHEAQYAGAAVMVAEVSPRPPRWSGRRARATAVAGILAASRRVVRHDRTARSWSWVYCLVVVGGNMRSK